MNNKLFIFSIRDITEISILCALAIVLDRFIKIPLGATGGSINIATLPLFIISYRHGWFKGFIGAGIVYSFTTCLLDAYGFQFLLFDYVIAFGSIAFAGVFGKKIHALYSTKEFKYQLLAIGYVALSVIIYCAIRTLSASVDSMIFYHYTFGASFIYNISYVGLSSAAVLVALILLLPVIYSVNSQYPTTFLKQEEN